MGPAQKQLRPRSPSTLDWRMTTHFSSPLTLLNDLVQKMMPPRFRDLGYTVCADNFFMAVPQILKFQQENTAVICTLRKNRVSRFFPKKDFQTLTKKLPKREFRRSIRIFETKISVTSRRTVL